MAAALAGTGCTAEGGSTGPGGSAEALAPPTVEVLAGDGAWTPPATEESAGPLAELRASVDLQQVAPDASPYPMFATAGPDAVYVVVRSQTEGTTWLVTVAEDGGEFDVVESVEIPGFNQVEFTGAMDVLPGGDVLVAGQFTLPESPADPQEYGWTVVDPASGAVARTVVVPTPSGFGVGTHSALSEDGRTLVTYVPSSVTGTNDRTLFSFDVATGAVIATHDVNADPVAAAYPSLHATALLARPGGGAVLVLDAGQDGMFETSSPVVAFYGADLQPQGEPVVLADPGVTDAEGAVIGLDGTVVVSFDNGRFVAVPDGGTQDLPLVSVSGDLLRFDTFTLEPAQQWAMVSQAYAAAPFDLTTGEAADPVDTGCRSGQGVRWVFPGADASTALMLGLCEDDDQRGQRLWIVGT
jgi:hypothetical protein